MKTTRIKSKKFKKMPLRYTKKETPVLNSTLASLTNEKFQNMSLLNDNGNNKNLIDEVHGSQDTMLSSNGKNN